MIFLDEHPDEIRSHPGPGKGSPKAAVAVCQV